MEVENKYKNTKYQNPIFQHIISKIMPARPKHSDIGIPLQMLNLILALCFVRVIYILVIFEYLLHFQDGRWNDQTCNSKKAVACQMSKQVLPPSPTPTPDAGCGEVNN